MKRITPKGSRKSTNPNDPRTPALAGADASVLTYVGRKSQVEAAVASCGLERTIEGASSITPAVHDPAFKFLNADALKGPKHGDLFSFVVLENLVFVLSGIHVNPGHMVETTLEEEAVWRLRQINKPLTMSRGHATRAQFIKHMFNEAGVPLVCPELDKKEPIQTRADAEKESGAERDRKRKPGFSAHAKLTVKTKPADSEQRENIEAALNVAASDQSGELAAEALLVAIIQEAEARNAPGGDGTSTGILQLLASTAAGLHVDPRDVHAVCHLFLTVGFYGKGGAIALAKAHPDWTPGEIAQAVQGSAFPDAYQVWAAEAKKMVDAYTGSDAEALQGNKTYAKEYQFRRGSPNGELEDSWKCARRLAEEVNWYLFIVAGTGYYFSPKQLFRSRARMLVAPGADGLIGHPTGGKMTSALHEDTITVEWHASKWGGPPGSIAEVDGYGPLDGRWAVAKIVRSSMKSSVTTVTLAPELAAKKEPAHEIGQRPSESSTESSGLGGPGDTTVPKASWNPSGKPIAKWIIPVLEWAAAHGWGGSVTSGFRTPAEQIAAGTRYAESLGKSVAEVYPNGLLASNHCKTDYPGGAVDVTEAAQLASVLKGYRGPHNLVWAQTTIEDGVHFSSNGH